MGKNRQPSKFLTPAEYANRYSVHVKTVRKWIKHGRLYAVNVSLTSGRPTYRIPQDSEPCEPEARKQF